VKNFRKCLGGMLVFLCLLGSCSIGAKGLEESTLQEEEDIEEKTKDPNKKNPNKKDDSEDEKKKDDSKEDETGDSEDTSEENPLPAAFINSKTLPENEIVFKFSDPVSFVSLSFDSASDLGYNVIEEEGSEIKIKLTGNPDPGLLVKADLQVTDEHDNIIIKQVTFRTKNNRVPDLQINELRTEYSKPKVEFIEFKIHKSGNMGALRVFVVGNNQNPLVYEFEPVEVGKGDYVALHLRNPEESCRDEYGANLNESGGTDSSPTARDFWVPGLNKLLHKTDAIYVLDQDNKVLDAVMIAENPSSAWDNADLAEAAEFLFKKGAWKSSGGTICSPANAVDSSKINTAITRSISRDETVANTNTAADWYITANSGATPGQTNNPRRL